jgi:predicted permease
MFGLAPAFVAARTDVQEVLRSGTRQSHSRRTRVARDALVSAQVALATLMLCGAALIGRSFMKLRAVDLRFDASKVVVAELAIRYDRYDNIARQTRLVHDVILALRAIPGVEGVSPVVAIPFSATGGWTGSARRVGQSKEDAAKNPTFNVDVVTPDYFSTMGLRVVRGRGFTDADRKGAEPVVVVSQAMARVYWPNQDPVGRRLILFMADEPFTVVGVVDDIRYRDLRGAQPSVYHAFAQADFPSAVTTFVIRTGVTEAAIVPALRRAIADAAPGVELATAAPFARYVDGPLAQPRLNAFLLGVFAVSAVLLAAIGLGGVVATTVRQRTPELGVRMALGATSGDIQRMILRQALAVAVTGVMFGIAAALAANRALAALLYDVSPTDSSILLTVAAFLTVTAAVAALVPARRSGSIEPTVALRSEG